MRHAPTILLGIKLADGYYQVNDSNSIFFPDRKSIKAEYSDPNVRQGWRGRKLRRGTCIYQLDGFLVAELVKDWEFDVLNFVGFDYKAN